MSGLTVSQKVIAAHQIGAGSVRPGSIVQISVDWVMASELALQGMMSTFDRLGNPALHDPARFYLAIDHTVDPISMVQDPKTAKLVRLSRQFAKDHQLSAFYDANETIMHTRFYREHGLPGQVIIGADSHTISHGALGAFAVGLGGADVALAAVTGQTWVEVPEAISVTYAGRLAFGLSGKDVILKTLGMLGRNTSALERSVEYKTETSDSVFSTDTRFTICNMTAELGGFNGIFEPCDETLEFLKHRNRNIDQARFFKADDDASYAEKLRIDIGQIPPQVAKPFSPDNVFDISDIAGQGFDGCFIGSCTTTEEELILAAMVLDHMWQQGLRPQSSTKRLVAPGDRETARKLADLGLLAVYERAGFRVGVPGCHLCLGLGSERAGEGEVWLSSQNRNYHNRMGKGSLAWLSSAAVVASSSQGMQLLDPRPFLANIDQDRYRQMLGRSPQEGVSFANAIATRYESVAPQPDSVKTAATASFSGSIQGRALCFGDHVDTDAIIPGEFCNLTDWAELGRHCFAYVRPEVPALCAAGQNIVVAGQAWGTGSAREHAVWSLIGAGVKLVIAKSFSAVHRRNLVNEGVPTLVVTDPAFFDLVTENTALSVDLNTARVTIVDTGQVFQAVGLSGIASDILAHGGIIDFFQRSAGKALA